MRLFAECGFAVVSARAIGIRRGLRALGWLPGQRRFQQAVPRRTRLEPAPGRPAGMALSPLAARAGHEDGQFETLAARIDAEIAARRTRLKRWRPYYYFHRAFKQLDAVPGAPALGYDFEFLLRKS